MSYNEKRLANVLQELNVVLPVLGTAAGAVFVGFGYVNADDWAKESGAVVALVSAFIGAVLAVMTASTTTANSAVVVKSISSKGNPSIWVAGDAHPLSTGTEIDPAVGLSALQSAAAGIRAKAAAPVAAAVDSDPAVTSLTVTDLDADTIEVTDEPEGDDPETANELPPTSPLRPQH